MVYKTHVLSDLDRAEMSVTIGIHSTKELFEDYLQQYGMEKNWWPKDLPTLNSVSEVEHFMTAIAEKNSSHKLISFAGAGCYVNYIHPAVDFVARLPGLLTSYTPYQPEISQGVLSSIFDFQQYICFLTNMEVANASLYSGAMGVVEAILMSFRIEKKHGPVGFIGVPNPRISEILKLFAVDVTSNFEAKPPVCIVCFCADFFGRLHDVKNAREIADQFCAKLVVSVSTPLVLTFANDLQMADIVVGEAGDLVSGPYMGGVQLGFLATKEKYIRQIPGRIVGKTKDSNNNICFSLILGTREQHIRKAKATSNICTNQTLYAVMFVAHCDLLGSSGFAALSENIKNKVERFAKALSQFCPIRAENCFNEFVAEVGCAKKFYKFMIENGVLPGVCLNEDDILICVSGKTTKNEIERYISLMAKFFESEEAKLEEINIDLDFKQSNLLLSTIKIPQQHERDVIRKFVLRDRENYCVDIGIYPLGSCTMKYNPRLNESVARFDGFVGANPSAPDEFNQGMLEICFLLEKALSAITGMDGCCLWPYAGAHGEFIGLTLIKAALKKSGHESKNSILIPVSAHGTNFASAALAGFIPIEIPVNESGIISLEIVGQYLNDSVAGIMITNPNTCGLFEKNINAISNLIKSFGGYVYCDGANLNAMAGILSLKKMGIDIAQINLHKTFSTPHGGGGPGSGPIVVSERLVDFLPNPRIVVNKNGENCKYELKSINTSVGFSSMFFGQTPALVRALTYILSLGPNGIEQNTKDAVLSANYLKIRLSQSFYAPYEKEKCMHEFVISDKLQKQFGASVDDIARLLMEYGIHPMTVHFPQYIKGSMLIEPTETQSLESLKEFIMAMENIASIIANSKDEINLRLSLAPQSLKYGRIDQITASEYPKCSC